MKVLIWGIGGRLGQTMKSVLDASQDAYCVGGVDAFASPDKFDVPVFAGAAQITVTPDVIIDFSRPDAVYDMLPYAIANGLPAVVATTGHDEKQERLLDEAAEKIAVFKASNMSLGINLLIKLVKEAAAALGQKFDVEIVETHHNVKADAPSGTALTIADAINGVFDGQKEYVFGRSDKNCRRKSSELGIHAVRGGTVVGRHEVMFLGNDEVITVSHEAYGKTVFAEGALKAARFILETPAGRYDMDDLLKKQ